VTRDVDINLFQAVFGGTTNADHPETVLHVELLGLTSLRQGHGGPPKRFAKAEDPRAPRKATHDRCRLGSV
jgi:hypothetical protein